MPDRRDDRDATGVNAQGDLDEADTATDAAQGAAVMDVVAGGAVVGGQRAKGSSDRAELARLGRATLTAWQRETYGGGS